MFIRHAEKPEKQQKGVTPDGEHDEHSLSVRGWTRAGALAALFGGAANHPELATPARIIATAPSHSYKSKREHDTALPTSRRLGVAIEATTIPEDYQELATDIQAAQEPTLVVWHHGSIPAFLQEFPIANSNDIPKSWPEDRFDLIWVLSPSDGGYRWQQVPQALLEGDAAEAAST